MPDKHPKVRKASDTYRKAISARWREDSERRTISWWSSYFEYCARSDFLMGRTGKDWRANLLWLTGKTNMEKTLAESYHHESNGLTSKTCQNLRAAQRWLEGRHA